MQVYLKIKYKLKLPIMCNFLCTIKKLIRQKAVRLVIFVESV